MKKICIIISEQVMFFKSSIFMLIVSLFAVNISIAQEQYELEWTNEYNTGLSRYTFGCPTGISKECQKVRLDSEGNVIVVGTSLANGNYDFLILKYSDGGTLLWEKLINISDETDEFVTAVFIDSNDNIFIAGVSDTTIFESQSILVKLNNTGEILWQSEFSDEYIGNIPFDILVDESGNTFITGTVANVSPNKMFTNRYDINGNLIWADFYELGNSTLYQGSTLKIVDNLLYTLGTSFSGFPQNKTMVLLKYSLDGELVFSNENSFEGDYSGSSHIDNFGNIYIGMSGKFKIIKCNSLGNEEWQFEVPTNLPDNVFADEVNDIMTDDEGNVYITGRHYGENYDDPDNYTNGDLQVNKIASDGTEIYSYRYENLSTNTYEGGEKMFLGYNGYLAIGGTSGDTSDGESESLAIVLNELGQPVEILKYYEAGTDNDITSVIMDENLNLYVTGTANFKAITQQYVFTGELSTPNFTSVENKTAPYPNPFSNSFEIETTNLSGLIYFTLYNSSGSIVSQSSFESGVKEIINTSSLPSGFYFYIIESGKVSNSGKLVKK